MFADLHLHTTYSDGTLSPFELLTKAKEIGLNTISITDHDTVGALDEAIAIGTAMGIEVISGVEFSSIVEDREFHILGYFFDYKNIELLSYLDYFRSERLKRAEKIVNILHSLKIPLDFDAVVNKVHGDSIGRPHIALALLEGGFVRSYQDAFNKYLGARCPAYIEKQSVPPQELFAMITRAGGLSFVAHPGKFLNDSLLQTLIQSGVDGIEVIHPSHSHGVIQFYRSVINEFFLLESGGSDFHGGERKDDAAFGKYTIPLAKVDTMRNRLFQSSISSLVE
ncbi:MAG: PHP domain-containing protein [Ignavibacteria bacterium]|nr:PHP domain-containing protein [Ignavibacteria bacterium]